MDTMRRVAIRGVVLLLIVMLLWMFGLLRTAPPVYSAAV